MKFHFNDPKIFLDGVGKAGRLTESDISRSAFTCVNEDLCHLLDSMKRYIDIWKARDTMGRPWPSTQPFEVKFEPTAGKIPKAGKKFGICFKTESQTV